MTRQSPSTPCGQSSASLPPHSGEAVNTSVACGDRRGSDRRWWAVNAWQAPWLPSAYPVLLQGHLGGRTRVAAESPFVPSPRRSVSRTPTEGICKGMPADRGRRSPTSPLPLGFLGLFAATTALACTQVGVLARDTGPTMSIGILAVTAGTQLIASVIGFVNGDVTAGTSMAILAGTWTAVAVSTLVTDSASPNEALGVVLLCSAAAMLVPAIADAAPPIARLVMTTTSVRFGITAIAEITAASAWTVAAGIIGFILAAVSFYAAFALAASTGRRWRLPLTDDA